MEKTRIAVVSTDGIHVDEHFGRAAQFLIYDLGEELTLVDQRVIEPLSVNDPHHRFDTDKFNRIAETLNDCCRVYVTQIGDTPAEKLRTLGIQPEIYKGAISRIAASGPVR